MNEICNAYEEIYYIFKNTSQELIDKIPNKLMNVIKNERNTNYFIEHPEITINDVMTGKKLLEKTKALMAFIFYNYWTESEEEKKTIYEVYRQNDIKYQEELEAKYSTENIFKSTQEKLDQIAKEAEANKAESIDNTSSIALTEYKKPIWVVIKEKFLSLFNKKDKE